MAALIESMMGVCLLLALMQHWIHISHGLASMDAMLDCQSRAWVAKQILSRAIDQAASTSCQDGHDPRILQEGPNGSVTIELSDCVHGMVRYGIRQNRNGEHIISSLYRQKVSGEVQELIRGVVEMRHEHNPVWAMDKLKLVLASLNDPHCVVFYIPMKRAN